MGKRTRADEIRDRRTAQLHIVQTAFNHLVQHARAVREENSKCTDLSSHLSGFYEEIDKLAKGKALLETSDLIVQQTNDIIRDAKNIINRDIYLARIKEFVPAGENPLYPDVLVTLRTIRQSLDRYMAMLSDQKDLSDDLMDQAREVVVGLQSYLHSNDVPTREEMAQMLDGKKISSAWLRFDHGLQTQRFDIDRLDRYELEMYFSNGLHEFAEAQHSATLEEESNGINDQNESGHQ